MRPSRPRDLDPFAVLGLAPGSTRAEVRRAYRRRAMAIHPDVAGTDTTAAMAELNHARDQLLGVAGSGEHATRPDDPASEATRAGRRRDAPEYSHAPTWDDYWSAWNDPPRRAPR